MYVIIFFILLIISPILYLFYLRRTLSRKVFCSTERCSSLETVPLPTKVLSDASKYVVFREVASRTVPTASLPTYAGRDQLLTNYLRLSMLRFSRLPQALILKYLIKDTGEKKSFDKTHIEGLDFKAGDDVCGTYRVASRYAREAEMDLIVPQSYRGPVVNGLLVVSIEERDDQTIFLNETIMWRKRNEGKVLLERSWGKWFHELTVGVLVESGTRKLMEIAKSKAL